MSEKGSLFTVPGSKLVEKTFDLDSANYDSIPLSVNGEPTAKEDECNECPS